MGLVTNSDHGAHEDDPDEAESGHFLSPDVPWNQTRISGEHLH